MTGMLIGLEAFFPLFMIRVLGAGDVKMIAFLLGHLGMASGIRIVLLGCAAAAVWGLGKMIRQRSFWRRMVILRDYIGRWMITKEVVPYYRAERDEGEGVIPFAVCLLLGFLGGYCLSLENILIW